MAKMKKPVSLLLALMLVVGVFPTAVFAAPPGGGGGGGIKMAYWTDTPSARADLVYNGEPQELITAGVAENGTPKYYLGADYGDLPVSEWSSDVPTATDPGTYIVWYAIDPDADAQLIGAYAVSLDVTIGTAHTHNDVLFEPWTSTTSLPDSGNWCLMDNVMISGTRNVAKNATLNLCLNGYGIRYTGDNGAVLFVDYGSVLNLYDCGNRDHYITLTNYRGTAVSDSGTETVLDSDGNGVVKVTGGYITGGYAPGDNVNGRAGAGVWIDAYRNQVDVYGTLNMYGGTIIGNCNKNAEKPGGGVSVFGAFNFHGGTIRNNFGSHGGGIGVEATSMVYTGLFVMDGGTVTENKGSAGGGIIIKTTRDGYPAVISGGTITNNIGEGVFVNDNGSLNLSGDLTISGNEKNGVVRDIFLQQKNGVSRKINVTAPITTTAPIVVNMAVPGVMTAGLDGNGSVSDFACGNASHTIILNASGEAEMVPVYTVTWQNYNDTTLEVDTEVLVGETPSYDGMIPTRPADDTYFYTFSGWNDGTSSYAPDALPAVTGNVTYTATYSQTQRMDVYLEFGTGHAALAAAFAQANSYTVSGTWVTMPAPADAADRWETRNIIGDVVTPYFAALNANPVIDAGERLYSTSEFAPQPMSAYADRDAFNTATEAWLDGVPSAGDVFYLLWESAYTGAMTLALDPLTCGQEVTVSNYGSIATNHTDPQPSYTLTGGVTDKWTDSWYASYDPETGTFGSFASGMIVGGTDYYTFIRIAAPFGYYIANAEETVTVTGAKQVWYPPGYTYNGGVEIALSATAQHGNWETDAIVTLEPTEYAEGEITYYCAVCDGVVRTEAIPVLTYHNVTVANNIQNGTVGVSTNRTYVGSTVTVTATPDNSELFLYSLCYSGDGQQDVTITEQDGIYSFIMPDYDVTVHGEFMLKNTVFVDFGAGHESFVQAAFGEAEDFTVNGSVVSFRFVPEWEELNNARGAKEMFEAIQNTYIQYNERMDNGESYMYAVALHPLAYYTQTYGSDAEAYVNNTENDELRDLSVENSITFYALWAQPVADAVVTVTPPACGTVMTTYYRNSTVQVLPSPVMTATGGLGFEDYMIFYNNWDIGLHDGETTTLTGGNAYTAYGFLTAPWGSFLPDDLTGAVSFEGGTLTSWDSGTSQFRLSVPVYHNYNANDICTGCGAKAPHDKMSVSVDDQIHLNLFLDLATRGKTVNDVSITFGGQPYACTGTKMTGGDYDGLYNFKVVMAPAQIAEAIVVTFGSGQGAETIPTSVKAYCTQLQDPQYTADYAKAQTLARAMLIYGQAANNVFLDGANEIADISALDPTAARNAAAIFSDTTGQLTGASFMALTKPEFRFYTGNITEEQGYAYNQAGVTATMTGGNDKLNARFVINSVTNEVLIEVTGVSAENMDKTITVNVTGLGTITFNGNTFAKAMARDTNPAATQALGAALYNYGVAAKNCFNA